MLVADIVCVNVLGCAYREWLQKVGCGKVCWECMSSSHRACIRVL